MFSQKKFVHNNNVNELNAVSFLYSFLSSLHNISIQFYFLFFIFWEQ